MKVLLNAVLIFAALMPAIHFVSCFFGEFPGVATLMADVLAESIVLGMLRQSWCEMQDENEVQRKH
jgi:hypothetical protein